MSLLPTTVFESPTRWCGSGHVEPAEDPKNWGSWSRSEIVVSVDVFPDRLW